MICSKEKCTGCFACYNICPKNCISMVEDDYGHIYPKIDEEKCIKCGLCKKVCPSLNKVEFNKTMNTYAAWSNKREIRSKSTSGGASAVFANEMVNNRKGIVYGAAMRENATVEQVRISNEQDLEKIKGSKYVHSYVKDTYKQVKDDLKLEKEVLYVGTPCQIAGLKNFLGKEYNNLVTVDIICHGVPSQKFLKEQIISILGNTDIDKVRFRRNNIYLFELENKGKIVYSEDREKVAYCQGFDRSLTLRDNCYDCMYARNERVADITIGDFWGLGNKEIFKEDIRDGVSVIMINTIKGKEFFDSCNKEMFYEERKTKEAIEGNEHLRHPALKNKNILKFKRYYKKLGFEKACFKALKRDITITKIKKVLKSNKLIYGLYQQIRKETK